MKKGFGLLLILILSISVVFALELRVTPGHPFFVDGNWVRAGELEIGDVLTRDDGSKVRVTSIEDVSLPVTVYNIAVLGLENYFANRVLVHNKNLKSVLVEDNFRTIALRGTEKEEWAAFVDSRQGASLSQKEALAEQELTNFGIPRDYVSETSVRLNPFRDRAIRFFLDNKDSGAPLTSDYVYFGGSMPDSSTIDLLGISSKVKIGGVDDSSLPRLAINMHPVYGTASTPDGGFVGIRMMSAGQYAKVEASHSRGQAVLIRVPAKNLDGIAGFSAPQGKWLMSGEHQFAPGGASIEISTAGGHYSLDFGKTWNLICPRK